jgi:hypothetical protein
MKLEWNQLKRVDKLSFFLIILWFFLLLAVFSPPPSAAGGESPFARVVPPHQITCDPLDLTQASGIYLYWRGKGATVFNAANRIPLTLDATHNPPLFDLLALKLACGDYEFAMTDFNAAGQESDFSNVVSYSYAWPWCPRVPAGQESVADHLNRIEAMIRALLLGVVAP